MSTLVAVDLDRTLIYSRGAVDTWGSHRELVVVERHEDADASWMTATAAAGLVSLRDFAAVLPVTTRTARQWRRVRLPGPPMHHAVVANGAVLLVDDVPDARWEAAVMSKLADAAPIAEIWKQAAQACRPEWTRSLRNADGWFCYAVLDRSAVPAGFLAEMAAWADTRGWRTSLQGRKLYWVPQSLTKSAAVAEVLRRTGATTVLAAGDSLLDADLLDAADVGIVARHGELVATGWHRAHVRVTEGHGLAAGAEIVDWLLDTARR